MHLSLVLGAHREDSTTNLGDHKPSALANHMLSTLSEFGPEIILQQIFLKCLPTYIQDAWPVVTSLTLTALVTRPIRSCHTRATRLFQYATFSPRMSGLDWRITHLTQPMSSTSPTAPQPSVHPAVPRRPPLIMHAATTSTSAKLPPVQAPLHLEGRKLPSSPPMAMSVKAADSTILHITDNLSGTTYLVDSRAEVLIVPCTSCSSTASSPCSSSSHPQLFAANGNPIWTCGLYMHSSPGQTPLHR